MTETPPHIPSEPTPGEPRKLLRSNTDRVIGGVAGGLARHLSVDPLLVRIVLAVLTVAFPPTLLGYIAALMLVPGDGEPVAPADNRNRILAAVLVGVLLLLTLPVLIPFGLIAGPPVLGFTIPLLMLAAIVWLAVRVLGQEGANSGRRIAVAIGMVVLAIGGFLAAFTAAVLGGGWIVAAIVVVCGVALMAAAFAGGARWLMAPALLLALPLAGVAAADVKLEGGVGERMYRPADVSEIRSVYELGVGEMEIDLREVEFPAGDTRLRIDVGVGEVRVLLPRDVCAAPDVHVGAGQVRIGPRQQAGVDVDWQESTAAEGVPRVILDAEIGLGELKVSSTRFEGGFFGDEDDSELFDRDEHCL